MQGSSLRSLLNGSGLSRLGMRAVTIFAALACISMIAASTAVITAKRYEERNKPRLVAGGRRPASQNQSSPSDQGGSEMAAGTPSQNDTGTAGPTSGPAATVAGPAATKSSGPAAAASNPGASAANQTAAPAQASGATCND